MDILSGWKKAANAGPGLQREANAAHRALRWTIDAILILGKAGAREELIEIGCERSKRKLQNGVPILP
jgi:hypothetical protein